jgi:hypothetical protein
MEPEVFEKSPPKTSSTAAVCGAFDGNYYMHHPMIGGFTS